MSGWVKLDNTMPEDPMLPGLSDRAFRLWINALCYCSRGETDGLVPRALMQSLSVTGSRAAIKELLSTKPEPMLLDRGEHYEVRNYLKFNLSKEEITLMKAKGSRRQALFRNKELREAVRQRDGDECRYCGITVDWKDRRGAKGGCYDHVDNHGPNTLANLVVACRGCNSAKGDRPDIRPRPLSSSRSRSDPTSDLSFPHARAGSGTGVNEVGFQGARQLTREIVEQATIILSAHFEDASPEALVGPTGAHPNADLIRGCHLAVAWAQGPDWRMPGCAATLAAALGHLEGKAPKEDEKQARRRRRGEALERLQQGATA